MEQLPGLPPTPNDARFSQWTEVYAYLLTFSRRWNQAVKDIRVVPDE